MSNTSDLSEIEQRAQRLLELLDKARLSSLDFDNREHLHIIELCLDTAIVHIEKIK
ncbi:MAG: hypothetical protein WBZ29_06030 [Methanocella sp.]